MDPDKKTDYGMLHEQAASLIESERWYVPALSNISALLYQSLEGINWAGFYLMDRGSLVLGPFQGRVACIRIEPGRGVCGMAVSTGLIQRVPDVHAFPGHIACDAASRSEIVLPIRRGGSHPDGISEEKGGKNAVGSGPEKGGKNAVGSGPEKGTENAAQIVGVLDIDSPEADRFSEEDEAGLAALADLIGREVDFTGLRD